MNQTPEWQRREKHHNDIHGLFEGLGYMRGGAIMKFNGPEFWPKAKELGHDATAYEACCCAKGNQP